MATAIARAKILLESLKDGAINPALGIKIVERFLAASIANNSLCNRSANSPRSVAN